MMQRGKIFSINRGKARGTAKRAVKEARLIEGFGLEGDVHGGRNLQQVSILAIESIKKQTVCPRVEKNKLRPKGSNSFGPGDFSENITTEDLDLTQLKIGDRLRIGTHVVLEISKIGKECHKYCTIYQGDRDCIMSCEGIFTKVLRGGKINIGDRIERCIK